MIDDLGARDLKRVFMFFKNVKNFGQLSTFGKLRTIAIPAVPVLLLGGGVASAKFQAVSVIEELNVTPMQQVMMQSCIDAHGAKNVNFGETVSTPKGCACAAKLVTSVVPPAHYQTFSAVQELAIDQYYWQYKSQDQDAIDAEWEQRVSAEMTTLAASQQLNTKGLRHIFDYVLSAEQICDMQESYEGTSLASLAELKPLETPIWEGDSDGVVEISLRGADAPLRVALNQ